MGGGDIMAGSKQPIELVVAKGKKHLSKAEIKERMESEIHAPSDSIEAPTYLTKKQKEKFNFYAQQLKDLNIMSNLDNEALAKYITTNDMYEMVTKKLRTSEVKNDTVLFEYYSKAQERYLKLSRSMANDLGLSISSRCKLVVPTPPTPPDNGNKFNKFRRGEE
jgi:P27 family predicted phage terminase small subunit